MPDRKAISKRLNPDTGPQPPGHFGFGTQLSGGPRFTDAFNSKQSPTPQQLIENYSALIYAMVARNRNAVTRLPMRLLADGSRVQGKPARACDPIKVSRAVGEKLAKSGQISSAAVDQVYEIRNHPLLDVLDNPDPYGYFSRDKLIGLLCAYQDVVGSAYLVPEGNGWDWTKSGRVKGPPEFLWVIYPQYVIPSRAQASPLISAWQYFGDRIPFDAAIWFRHTTSLRDAYGSAYSPTYAGESYRKQEQEQVAIFSQVLGLGPRPNMIATAKDPLMGVGETEAKAFEQDLVRKQSGAYAGGILVNRGAWDFTPVSYSPADMAGMDVSVHDLHVLACIFDQPPTYYTVDSNLANLQAADKEHWEKGVEPRCRAIAGTFTRLAKQFDQRLSFQFDHGLAEDELVKAQTDKIYVDMGAITINQLNQDKKLPAVEWGDEPMFPTTMLPYSMLVAQHEQTMQQQQAAVDSMGTQDELAADDQDHTQKMDKAGHKLAEKGHELAKKKLQQDAKAKQERMIMDLTEQVLRDCQSIQQELRAS